MEPSLSKTKGLSWKISERTTMCVARIPAECTVLEDRGREWSVELKRCGSQVMGYEDERVSGHRQRLTKTYCKH